jgi:hypothetical protein
MVVAYRRLEDLVAVGNVDAVRVEAGERDIGHQVEIAVSLAQHLGVERPVSCQLMGKDDVALLQRGGGLFQAMFTAGGRSLNRDHLFVRQQLLRNRPLKAALRHRGG